MTEREFQSANTRLLERRAEIAGNRSDPQRIGEIVPKVSADIQNRNEKEVLV